MTQDERWNIRYKEVMDFIETNHRNPSKHHLEEKLKHNWIHRNRKFMNQWLMKPERVEKFKELLKLCEQYKRKNQYQ